MSTLSRFMAFGSQARLYIIKLRNCLNNNVDLAVPFTKHNFGCFGRIFFVIVLFESLSKTLFRVLFSRLYHQIWILLPYLHFWSDCEKIPIGCLYCMTLQMPEIDSTGQNARICVILTSSQLQELLIGQVLCDTRACK
jgi:hypothetical protein